MLSTKDGAVMKCFKSAKILVYAALLSIVCSHSAAHALALTVDCNNEADTLAEFWNRFGFSPAQNLFSDKYKVYIAYAASAGIKYARIHRMLELFDVEENNGQYSYDWTDLDRACDVLFSYGLHHQFEFDAKFGGIQDPRGGCENLEDAQRHRTIISAMVSHLVDRYGKEEVAQWWWESPNEGQLPWDERGVRYWDACTHGLADVDPDFATRFGGPAAIYRKDASDFIINHLETTPNVFTGEQEHVVGFVSAHIKYPATTMINQTIDDISKLVEAHPEYRNVYFVNDEHDPWNGWGKEHEWAAGPKFGAWMCNAVYQGQLRIIEGLGQPYFTSTDNGFLSTSWFKRTQGVVIEDGNRFAMIKKPSHNAFTVLSLLGNYRLELSGAPDVTSGIGAMATINTFADGQIAVMLFNEDQENVDITVALENLPFTEAMLSHFRIDEQHSNPYRIVQNVSGTPDAEQLKAIREEMELAYFEEPSEAAIDDHSLRLECSLPTNSVSLFLVSPKPENAPAPVVNLSVEEFNGLHGPEKLLTWRDTRNHRLRTYKVLFSESEDGPYRRVNDPDILCKAYMLPASSETGFYRVQAVDLWERTSDDAPVWTHTRKYLSPKCAIENIFVLKNNVHVAFSAPFAGTASFFDHKGRRIAHFDMHGAKNATFKLENLASSAVCYEIQSARARMSGMVIIP